ncbi:MAG: hypothetical protein ACRDDZ_07055 [Marinifilaceae bacterium]
MYKVIDYISDLLYLYDCVIVPDFGAFVCNHSSASFDEKTGIISPPAKYVVFNSNIKHNDGLLIDWIATKEGCDYKKAQIKVSLFVEEIKIRLNQRQRIRFGQLGEFTTDRKFNIVFQPERRNFSSESIGMEQLQAKRVKTVEPQSVTSGQAKVTENATVRTGKYGVLQRMFRFAFMTVILLGVAVALVITFYDPMEEYVSNPVVNNMSIQPSMEKVSDLLSKPVQKCGYIIAPDSEYIEYDVAMSLPQ